MPAFTFDVSTPVGLVRLYAGDADPDGLNRAGGDRTRTDTEIQALLNEHDQSARLAAAALLESKAAEYASLASDISQGGLRQDFRTRSTRLQDAAAILRSAQQATAIPLFNEPSQPTPLTLGEGGTMSGW